jgi:ATP-dependent Lon protease
MYESDFSDAMVGAGGNDDNTKIEEILYTKISTFIEINKKTLLHCHKMKLLNVLGTSEVILCERELNNIMDDIRLLELYLKDITHVNIENVIKDIQNINNRISSVIKKYGTQSIEDLIKICFGHDYLDNLDVASDMIRLWKDYLHPVSYKYIKHRPQNERNKASSNTILDDIVIVEKNENGYMSDIKKKDNDPLYYVLNGIKLVLHSQENDSSLLITCLVDKMNIEYLIDIPFIFKKYYEIKNSKMNEDDFLTEAYDIYSKSLTLKDYLIYDVNTIQAQYIDYLSNIKALKHKSTNKIVNDFIKSSFFMKREKIIQLLLFKNDRELQYLAYLLFDTISSSDKNILDTFEQNQIYDSLPTIIQHNFKCAIKQTIEYITKLSDFDIENKLPLEQRICLMKAPNKVKEKAMTKYKEVKAKSDDTGTKARHYLDGLLKIPFNIYKKEPVFAKKLQNIEYFKQIEQSPHISYLLPNFKAKDEYTSVVVSKYVENICDKMQISNFDSKISLLTKKLNTYKKKDLIDCLTSMKEIFHSYNVFSEDNNIDFLLENEKLSKFVFRDEIINMFKNMNYNTDLINALFVDLKLIDATYSDIYENIQKIKENDKQVCNYIKDVRYILDESVYGHSNAKKQMERIIGQWVNGTDSGYCLGFEGPPGVGKTSLAKLGISKCLLDEEGKTRPFAFIAIGGSTNGSTLDGHNYTYVGSTWGRIVDILIEHKCMNPIIFIDEVDKVSRTENGREIISILTHLIDPTQNDTFQDKYFSGIDFDLSKVLFIFSYNDPSLLDRIMLDRIHRIKFDHLTLDDKKIISRKHLLPEIYNKMGLRDTIVIDDDVIEYLVEEYTNESGVRKLKELLYEIVGEINLEIIRNESSLVIPYEVTREQVEMKYLKEHHSVMIKKVHSDPMIGIMNGLWANSLGKGGIIPIQASFYPSNTFLDFKLTGQQGDVMKESMNVAKTLAWTLLSTEKQKKWIEHFEKTKNQGIHIHCPEGAVPKDGPSAGTAITIAIFSLLSEQKIDNTLAITGEMNLQGFVTAIGGLDMKIIGGINAGVKTFLFPTENKKDYDKFIEKYEGNTILTGIKFITVDTIHEAIKYALIKKSDSSNLLEL